MKISYQETAKDLLVRIDIHEKYGARSIDKWTVDVLQPKPGMRILDVGCGSGKQCFLYSDTAGRKANITGGDVSAELLERARATNAERGDGITFRFLDFNKKFEFADDTFDLVSSAFAIYYATDLEFTFGEAHRVLKPGGRLFVTGPLPENKQMFYDIIHEASREADPADARLLPLPDGDLRHDRITILKDGYAHVRESNHVSGRGALHGVRRGIAFGGSQALDLHVRWRGGVRRIDRADRGSREALASEGRETRHDQSGRRDPCHQVEAARLPARSRRKSHARNDSSAN